MVTRFIIFIFFFTFFNGVLISQTREEKINLESKYWVWRDRLINDFMVPNFQDSPGRGIVFGSRGCDYYWQDTINGLTNNEWITGGFNIPDEGFEMGKYLLVLATEWYILHYSNLSTGASRT